MTASFHDVALFNNGNLVTGKENGEGGVKRL